MAVDYPDYQTYVGLTAAIVNLQASIDALAGGYGQSITPLFAVVTDNVTSSGVIIANPAGNQTVVITGVTYWWQINTGPHRGEVQCQLLANNISFDTINGAVLTPEVPTFSPFIAPGAVRTSAGIGLRYAISNLGAASADSVKIVIDYYLE